MLCMFRAAYEYPKTGTRGRITFIEERERALPWAAEYVKHYTNGYLLSLVELRPASVQRELVLT